LTTSPRRLGGSSTAPLLKRSIVANRSLPPASHMSSGGPGSAAQVCVGCDLPSFKRCETLIFAAIDAM
jgi:hypothetical protein